jgi:hypothetical protein
MFLLAAESAMGVFVGIGAVLAIIAAVIVAGFYFERKRTQQFKAAADELGFHFAQEGESLPPEMAAQFELFGQGRRQKVSNLMFAESDNVRMSLFDYCFTIGSGKHARTIHQTVLYLQSADMHLPQFVLRPENLLHKIGSVFGFKDIDFESHPRFSKMFLLRGNNEPAIRHVFTPEVLTFFEEHSGVCVEASEQQLLLYRAGKRIPPAKLREFLEYGFGVHARFREHVVS